MMKIYLALLLFSLSLQATHLNWLGNYDKALQHAKKEQKDLMVYLVKEGTPACQKTIKKSLMNHPYIQRLKSKFVSVIVTYEGRTSYPIEMYYSQTFPTLFFVDSLHERFLTPPLYGDMITPSAIKGFLDE